MSVRKYKAGLAMEKWLREVMRVVSLPEGYPIHIEEGASAPYMQLEAIFVGIEWLYQFWPETISRTLLVGSEPLHYYYLVAEKPEEVKARARYRAYHARGVAT